MKELLAITSDFNDERLPAMARELLVLQVEHLRAIESRIAELDGRLLPGLSRRVDLEIDGEAFALGLIEADLSADAGPAGGRRALVANHAA